MFLLSYCLSTGSNIVFGGSRFDPPTLSRNNTPTKLISRRLFPTPFYNFFLSLSLKYNILLVSVLISDDVSLIFEILREYGYVTVMIAI